MMNILKEKYNDEIKFGEIISLLHKNNIPHRTKHDPVIGQIVVTYNLVGRKHASFLPTFVSLPLTPLMPRNYISCFTYYLIPGHPHMHVFRQ